MSPNSQMKKFYLPQRKVVVGTDETGEEIYFHVRGVNLEDLASLVERHGPSLVAIYDRFTKRPEPSGYDPITGEEIYDSPDAMPGMNDTLTFVMKQSPGLAADIVAHASRGAVDMELARQLPATVQLEALMAIGELTFRSEDDLKKFLAAATQMLMGVSKAVAKAVTAVSQTPSGTGT